ncbi:MAG: response regulator transcription factor [Rhodocyclaceae bacterium]|nr:response regulator transcription factor [Rhodocyclaceae bacterium]MCP5308784.1 response regulator transcription factor [Zoogloeaceae bacterium]
MSETLAHIVDDDEAIRDALAWLFETRGVACRSWSSGEAFLSEWQADWRGCIVLDIRMGGMSGLACFDALRQKDCQLPIIFLTGHGDVPMAVSAIKNGAFDFVEKPFNDNDLVDIVVNALDADARSQQIKATRENVIAQLAQLTAREREVMDQILAGKFNKIIADELSISMRTVEVHRARVFEKMGVRSAVELAQQLSSTGLMPGQAED